MKITERLNVEHGVFLTMLERLEDLVQLKAPSDVLAGVAQTVLDVIEPHCRIEDRWLYPTLAGAFGHDFPPLAAAEAEHHEIQKLAREVQGVGCSARAVSALVVALGSHIEKEIHLIFPLAEEWIPEETLSQMCDWYAEHVRDRSGRHATRQSEKWPG